MQRKPFSPYLPRATTARLHGVLALAALSAMLLGGCVNAPSSGSRVLRYDLGPLPTLPRANTATPADGTANVGVSNTPATPLPLLKVAAVTAPTALDNDNIAYRLVYADPRRSLHYGASAWTATPAQLMTERLRSKLASVARVLDGGDSEKAPLLRVELLDFSQRFDAPERGQGVVTIRASLKNPSTSHSDAQETLLAQRAFTAIVPGLSPDAEGGTAAIGEAADAVLDSLRLWIGQVMRASASGSSALTPAAGLALPPSTAGK